MSIKLTSKKMQTVAVYVFAIAFVVGTPPKSQAISSGCAEMADMTEMAMDHHDHLMAQKTIKVESGTKNISMPQATFGCGMDHIGIPTAGFEFQNTVDFDHVDLTETIAQFWQSDFYTRKYLPDRAPPNRGQGLHYINAIILR